MKRARTTCQARTLAPEPLFESCAAGLGKQTLKNVPKTLWATPTRAWGFFQSFNAYRPEIGWFVLAFATPMTEEPS